VRLSNILPTVAMFALPVANLSAQTPPAFDFQEVAPGVYCAIGNGSMNVGANVVAIVNDREVLLVDSATSPAAALRLKEELKRVTDRPVRYVVNTHFHFDHTFGNQVFAPEAVIIGHEYTRQQLPAGTPTGKTYTGFMRGVEQQIGQLKRQADQETDPAKKAELLEKARFQEKFQSEVKSVTVLPPNLTFPDRITLFFGNRKIELIHFGPAHTAGDVVVYLPAEKLVCTGDLYNGYVGYLGDAFANQWADALGEFEKLDFETVVPGHGKPFKGKERIPIVQACLRDLWAQARALKGRGVSAADAAKQIDLTKYKTNLPQFSAPGVSQAVAKRIFKLLREGK
jgi:cyclase